MLQKGIQQGVQKSINIMRILRQSDNEIVDMIMEQYDITEEEIRKYMHQ